LNTEIEINKKFIVGEMIYIGTFRIATTVEQSRFQLWIYN